MIHNPIPIIIYSSFLLFSCGTQQDEIKIDFDKLGTGSEAIIDLDSTNLVHKDEIIFLSYWENMNPDEENEITTALMKNGILVTDGKFPLLVESDTILFEMTSAYIEDDKKNAILKNIELASERVSEEKGWEIFNYWSNKYADCPIDTLFGFTYRLNGSQAITFGEHESGNPSFLENQHGDQYVFKINFRTVRYLNELKNEI